MLSGPTGSRPEEMSFDTRARFDSGVDLAEKTNSNLLLVGGAHRLMMNSLMKRGTNLHDDQVFHSGRYRETVGNALDAKPIIQN